MKLRYKTENGINVEIVESRQLINLRPHQIIDSTLPGQNIIRIQH